MSRTEKRVLLGMSGGTDSSVSAMLLQDSGFEVVGVTFRFYELNHSTEYLDDARDVASRLGIEHITYDARDVFKAYVVDYFIAEYMSGRTPVPCVLCNNSLKWPLLARLADRHGIASISTGHYVRKQIRDGRHYIRQGADPEKDQSFFLWGLPQHILERMVLPMGGITKTEARALAARRGFEKVAGRKDSTGVCFCPSGYHTFLRQHVDEALLKPGRFVDEDGRFIAPNEGYPFYTVGQRRGLGIHLNRAVFVKDIDPEKNEVTLAPLRSLEKNEMILKNWNIIDESSLLCRDDIIVKIRYRKQANRCTVSKLPDGTLHVRLHDPLTSVAPGQAAAFYKDELLLGGGIIC